LGGEEGGRDIFGCLLLVSYTHSHSFLPPSLPPSFLTGVLRRHPRRDHPGQDHQHQPLTRPSLSPSLPPSSQEYFGVTPDVTTLGKVIGGGLPVGAYGGRKDIMSMVAPAGPMYQVRPPSLPPSFLVGSGVSSLPPSLPPSAHRRLWRTQGYHVHDGPCWAYVPGREGRRDGGREGGREGEREGRGPVCGCLWRTQGYHVYGRPCWAYAPGTFFHSLPSSLSTSLS